MICIFRGESSKKQSQTWGDGQQLVEWDLVLLRSVRAQLRARLDLRAARQARRSAGCSVDYDVWFVLPTTNRANGRGLESILRQCRTMGEFFEISQRASQCDRCALSGSLPAQRRIRLEAATSREASSFEKRGASRKRVLERSELTPRQRERDGSTLGWGTRRRSPSCTRRRALPERPSRSSQSSASAATRSTTCPQPPRLDEATDGPEGRTDRCCFQTSVLVFLGCRLQQDTILEESLAALAELKARSRRPTIGARLVLNSERVVETLDAISRGSNARAASCLSAHARS